MRSGRAGWMITVTRVSRSMPMTVPCTTAQPPLVIGTRAMETPPSPRRSAPRRDARTRQRVACELHIEGTHTGPLPTPGGDIPATGQTVSFDVAEILELDEDGRVVEHREYMDPGALMTQLGLVGT